MLRGPVGWYRPKTTTSRRYAGRSHPTARDESTSPRESAETAPGRIVRQRAAGRRYVEDLQHHGGVPQVASDVHVFGPAGFENAGAGGVDAVHPAVGQVMGQRARLDDAVQAPTVPVPAGAAARRDGDLAEHVIGAVFRSLPQRRGAD